MKFAKLSIAKLILGGVLCFCIGCPSASETVSNAELDHSPTELVDSAIEEIDEFEFCLSEDAGIDSLKESLDRLHKIVEALPESVSTSEMQQSQKDKLNKAIEGLKPALESLASSVESQATASKLSKASSQVLKKLKAISKMTR